MREPRLADVMDGMPYAFALTFGPLHKLVYANAAFRSLLGHNSLGAIGSSIGTDIVLRDGTPFAVLLDRAFRTGASVGRLHLDQADVLGPPLTCSIWPTLGGNAEVERLLIELRPSTPVEETLALQREVAERLLVSALRDQQSADDAEASRRSASFLANESRRLAQSLDESETIGAITRTRLPYVGAWCVVDLLADDHTMHRLTVIHPDPAKQAVLVALEGRWIPEANDLYGLPATLRDPDALTIAVDLAALLSDVSHPSELQEALQTLGAGPSLIVPMRVGDHLLGAIMFVGAMTGRAYTDDDARLATELAERSAAALDRARLYGESMASRIRAESASEAKSTFLGMMSHELRTPLNAIAGYVDLIDMELRGPVSAAQRTDLARIRTNQQYLTGLINDLLNLTKVSGGKIAYKVIDVVAQDVIETSRALVAPLMTQRHLEFCDRTDTSPCIMRGDHDRIVQILVNLLSNAIKFTAPGGKIEVACGATETAVSVEVRDSGIGIPADKLETIFDPFVQIDGNTLSAESGVGLGLAISRGLARAMNGDLMAESNAVEGTRLTLTLPRSIARH